MLQKLKFGYKSSLSAQRFVNQTIGHVASKEINVKILSQAILYNGGAHLQPDFERDNLKEVYQNVVINNFDENADSLLTISNAVENTASQFLGMMENDNLSAVSGDAPMIVNAGKLINPQFDRSAMQVRAIIEPQYGIRLIMDLKIRIEDNVTNRSIVSIGHREHKSSQLKISINKKTLLFYLCDSVVASIEAPDTCIIKCLDVRVFEGGGYIIYFEGKIVSSGFASTRPRFRPGKLVLGANLEAEEHAKFANTFLILETINRLGKTGRVLVFAQKLIDWKSVRITAADHSAEFYSYSALDSGNF